MELGGIHHVTAVTADAPRNVKFYTDTLGLRLVKKTVNQDDVSAYHLFYGDEIGHPGTEMTFFDWSGIGPHVPGAGTISSTAFRVPEHEALDWWDRRFWKHGGAHLGSAWGDGRAWVRLPSPSGLRL